MKTYNQQISRVLIFFHSLKTYSDYLMDGTYYSCNKIYSEITTTFAQKSQNASPLRDRIDV